MPSPLFVARVCIYNGQLNQRQRDATMVEIAAGIVAEEPSEDQPMNELRDWAIERLVIHGGLGEQSAAELRETALTRSQVAFEVDHPLLKLVLMDVRCRQALQAVDFRRESTGLKPEHRRRSI
ncbi:hypothetical protein [uncultured Roseobacter sp.]|uniref:hypothetical protein n=1 Tax=uncultured Roseobacter sp. TaxID=114847 RepID=UPI00262DCFB1|nr:hypothetical protein [uncultured Roseobacter sp.]